MSEINEEEREKFKSLMADYRKGGGPFIMINLNDLWQGYEGDGYTEPSLPTDNAGGLIRSAVKYEVRNSFKNRIHDVAAATATDFVHNELNGKIRSVLNDIFDNGYTRIEVDGYGNEIEIREASVQEQVTNLINEFMDVNRGDYPRINCNINGKIKALSLRNYIDELVSTHLRKETKAIIKDINHEVLEEAKKSISATVSDQLFSGLNILPKIGGVKQG